MKVFRLLYLIISIIIIVFLSMHYFKYQFDKKIIYVDKTKEELIDYFNDIALGSEYGDLSRVIRKWKRPLKLYIVKDSLYSEQIEFIEKTVKDINKLITSDFNVSVTKDSLKANGMLFLCSEKKIKTYSEFYTKIFKRVDENTFGYFHYLQSENNIIQVYIFINTSKNINRQKGAILEEITQSLGLGNDSYLYPTSIFYEPKIKEQIFTTKYSEFDRKIIKLLYHPKIKVGMNRLETEKIIRDIINSNKI